MSKYMLIILNFLSMLLGMCVLAVGIYSTAIGSQVNHLISINIPLSVLLLGLLLVATSAYGLWATFSEDRTHLRVYFFIISSLLFLQVIASAMALARRGDVDLMLYDAWGRARREDHDLLEKIEKTYACCGFATLHDRAWPVNCPDVPEFGFIRPCREVLGSSLKSTLRNLGLIGLVFSLLQGLALVFALAMYSDFLVGEREGVRLAEARHLLREGRIEAHQVKV